MLGNKESQLGQRIIAWGAPTWVCPEEWLPLPELTEGQERLVGLYRVNNASNQCVAFTVSGAYTVDWGDGSSNDYAAGAKAEHTYTFGDLDPDSETSEGWRQAIISITPQAGAALTSINLTSVHSVGTANYTSWWLDICVVGAGLTSCLCGGIAGASLKPLSNMRRFQFIGTNSIANFGRMFQDCSSLQSVPLFDTSSGTNFSYMFRSCSSLQSVPLFDTSSGTSFSNMFYGCSVLYAGALSGTRYTISYGNCKLDRAAIVAVFNALGTAVPPAQTITVTGNPGVPYLTPEDIAIATDKGWAVAA